MSAAMPSRSPTSTPGCASAEAREQPGDVDVAGGQQRTDPDAPAQDAAQLVDLRAGAVHLGQDAAGAGGDRLARPRSAVTRRLVRSNSGVPSSCSSRRIWCDSADWARWSSSAARVKWRWRATASTLRSCRSSTRTIVDHDRCGENYVLPRSIVAVASSEHGHERAARRRRRPPAGAGGRRRRTARRSPDRPHQRRLRDRRARALARRDDAHHARRSSRELIGAGEIAVAARAGGIAGSRAAPRRRGRRERVRDAGRRRPISAAPGSAARSSPSPSGTAASAGCRAMQLELLAPARVAPPEQGVPQGLVRPDAATGSIRTRQHATTPIRTSRRCSPRRATSRSTRSRCRRAASAGPIRDPAERAGRRRSRSGSA